MRISTFFPGARIWLSLTAVTVIAAALGLTTARASAGPGGPVTPYHGVTAAQRETLLGIPRDTWKIYPSYVYPCTLLQLDNLTFAGCSATPTGYGRYTSAANIGVYLWAVVAAQDLGLVSRPQARDLVAATLNEV